ncbi:MAG: beta-CASP ribonuclease aCPSF1 [Candidatus Woesearchaeota archaeon]|nr:MAG: beta-CASP ribonuclease aCPSF1 [Candidatus Woesearchaeota archaeon]
MTSEIIEEVLKHLPRKKIKEVVFEGANIVVYTSDETFFANDEGLIRNLVNTIKKRVELRPDPSICMPLEEAEKTIRQIIDKEVSVDNVIFDPQRSIVILEVDKPGTAIGRRGETIQEIKKKTRWVPIIRRTPPIRSQIIENIRSVLYQNSDYRRKFLHKTGERIYNGWLRRERKEEWVRLTYLGGGRQVGRSCLFLQTPESRILLDVGIDVSKNDSEAYPYLEAPEFNIQQLDAVIVSHAHVDHSALVPYLFKFGYRGPVYCTEPTRDIMALLQLDIIKIMREEGKEPLYSSDEVKEMVKHTVALGYDEVTDITPDIRITLHNAGHILGSSMVHINVGNGLHNLLYSADLKYAKTQLLSPAVANFSRCETLLIESTYGGKDNVTENPGIQDKILSDIVINTVNRGGKILMPTLGSGRGQEVIILIERLVREGKIPEIPVYIDGMVWDITAIHTAYPEFMNNQVKTQIFQKDNNPFLMKSVKQIGSMKERKELVEEEGPCIILATSGMMQGGPSVYYFRQLAGNPKHSLVFSCYQGEGTLGRRIKNGEKEFTFKDGPRNEIVNCKLEVHRIEISAHADRRELMSFVTRCKPRPKKVIINHGEVSRSIDLASSIHKTLKVETIVPRNLETIRLR